MAEYFAGGHLRFINGEWRDDNGDVIEISRVRHGRCDVCGGNSVLTQDAYNGYSLEIDAEQQEAAVWYGDECLAVFHIDFCPECGAKMDGGDQKC